MAKPKKIHFVGIKGVGMAPLAIIAKEAGIEVTGSDVAEEFITDEGLKKAGIIIYSDFSEKNITGADLVVYTSAHQGLDNSEVKAATAKGIKTLNQGRALSEFQNGLLGKKYKTITVTGSHGKTTTSAIISTVLSENRLDPAYLIGTSQIPSLGASGHFGKGKYFVSEGDEYFADAENDKVVKFLLQTPEIIVVTNVDFDHPDIFSGVEEIRNAFVQFSQKLPSNGVLVACGDGDENRKFLAEVKTRKVTYGFSPDNDYVLERVSMAPDKMFFWVKSHNASLGQFSMQTFGEQNALNALSAIIVGLEIGLTVEQIKKGLSKFSGTKRRSEFIGKLSEGALLYDDYGHHPEEIKKTLSAFRKSFPKAKIVCIFQPHMYSRTQKLFSEFSTAFSDANEVIISEIFPSFREEKDPNFSASLLVEEIKKYGKNAMYFPTLSDVVKYLSSRSFDKSYLIITMGAGDIYKVGREIINKF